MYRAGNQRMSRDYNSTSGLDSALYTLLTHSS